MKIKRETYDPSWLIKIAKEQIPEETEIIESMNKCTSGFWESRAYIYFVDRQNANEEGSEWQFDRNIMLTDKKKGEIILDILIGNKIGGIEFLKYL